MGTRIVWRKKAKPRERKNLQIRFTLRIRHSEPNAIYQTIAYNKQSNFRLFIQTDQKAGKPESRNYFTGILERPEKPEKPKYGTKYPYVISCECLQH